MEYRVMTGDEMRRVDAIIAEVPPDDVRHMSHTWELREYIETRYPDDPPGITHTAAMAVWAGIADQDIARELGEY